MAEYKFLIKDMMCEHCEKRIRATVEAGKGTVKSLDLGTKEVVIETPQTAGELIAAIDDAGYTAELQ